MIVPLDVQVYSMLVLALAGMGLGIVFDLYRVVRAVLGRKSFVTSVGDAFFWVLATLGVFGALIVGNWGELRLYVFLALCAGVVVYYYLASEAVVQVAGYVAWPAKHAVVGSARFAARCVSAPVRGAAMGGRLLAGKLAAVRRGRGPGGTGPRDGGDPRPRRRRWPFGWLRRRR